MWQPRRQERAEPGLLQRLLAVLTFDSGAASPLAFGTPASMALMATALITIRFLLMA